MGVNTWKLTQHPSHSSTDTGVSGGARGKRMVHGDVTGTPKCGDNKRIGNFECDVEV